MLNLNGYVYPLSDNRAYATTRKIGQMFWVNTLFSSKLRGEDRQTFGTL